MIIPLLLIIAVLVVEASVALTVTVFVCVTLHAIVSVTKIIRGADIAAINRTVTADVHLASMLTRIHHGTITSTHTNTDYNFP